MSSTGCPNGHPVPLVFPPGFSNFSMQKCDFNCEEESILKCPVCQIKFTVHWCVGHRFNSQTPDRLQESVISEIDRS